MTTRYRHPSLAPSPPSSTSRVSIVATFDREFWASSRSQHLRVLRQAFDAHLERDHLAIDAQALTVDVWWFDSVQDLHDELGQQYLRVDTPEVELLVEATRRGQVVVVLSAPVHRTMMDLELAPHRTGGRAAVKRRLSRLGPAIDTADPEGGRVIDFAG